MVIRTRKKQVPRGGLRRLRRRYTGKPGDEGKECGIRDVESCEDSESYRAILLKASQHISRTSAPEPEKRGGMLGGTF